MRGDDKGFSVVIVYVVIMFEIIEVSVRYLVVKLIELFFFVFLIFLRVILSLIILIIVDIKG